MNSRIWIRRKHDKTFSPAKTSKYDRYFRFNNPPWIHGRETDTKRIA